MTTNQLVKLTMLWTTGPLAVRIAGFFRQKCRLIKLCGRLHWHKQHGTFSHVATHMHLLSDCLNDKLADWWIAWLPDIWLIVAWMILMDRWKDGQTSWLTSGWMDGSVDGQMDVGVAGWLDGWMDGWTDGWVDGWYGWVVGWVVRRMDGWSNGKMDR